MASFTERINVIIDVTTDKATKGLQGFKSAVSEAEGFTGKLKAGTASLGQTFGMAAKNPAMMATAVTAAGVAAFAAADQYADLGLAVGEMSDATGLATEDASRWIETAGDLGIEVGAVQSAIGKLNKTIDPTLFNELGISIERTRDGATDVNGTFLNVIDKLNSIKDPAERARVASKLLGKGWQDMAELIGQGSGQLKKSLGEVADVKVLSPDEVKKAREFREGMDKLKDSLQEAALTIGKELLPVVVELADDLVPVAKGVALVVKSFTDLGESALHGVSASKVYMEAVNKATAAQEKAKDAARLHTLAISDHGYVAGLVAAGEAELARQTEVEAQAMRNAASAAADAELAFKAFMDQLSQEQAFDAVQTNMDELIAKLGTGEELSRADKLAMEEMFASTIANGNLLAAQNFKVAVDNGDLITAQYIIDSIKSKAALGATFLVSAGVSTSADLRNLMEGRGKYSTNASGTSRNPGGLTLVGENGPELLNLPTGSQVIPAATTAGMGSGGNVININNLSADPRLVVEAVKKYLGRGGVL